VNHHHRRCVTTPRVKGGDATGGSIAEEEREGGRGELKVAKDRREWSRRWRRERRGWEHVLAKEYPLIRIK
jgi:uncharacterized membrane protein